MNKYINFNINYKQMHSHNRSYSFSSWGKDSNYRSKSRDLPVEPLKKQYYYYNDNF